MNFYDKIQETQDNVSFTENGMQGYKTTNHALLDFNFSVSSYRRSLAQGVEDFKKVLREEDSYVLKYLMYLRDAREGLGERDLFRACLSEFLKSNFEDKDTIVKTIIKTTSNYGRFDDLFVFVNTRYEDLMCNYIKEQLREDCVAYKNNKPISLLAKWMPSENATSKETKKLARFFIEKLDLTPKHYRTILSSLRKYLDVVEVKTCANEWDKIDYNTVPSKANLKYTNAFYEHDEARRREFLSKVLAGDKSVKVNMSVTFPHEIVHQYNYKRYDQALEAYWQNLKPCVGLQDTIVVRDGSGSMCQRVGNSNVTAMDVSTALAIYCSQFLNKEFKDKFITFSSRAKLVDLSNCGSLKSKLDKTYEYNDMSNTNIQNVFELILDTALEHNMKQEDIPSTILIISDMEFDAYGERALNGSSNVFNRMRDEFKSHGYTLPKLAFWNVNSRTNTIPCKVNDNGILLISGFSPNVLSMVMSGEVDPYKALLKELDKERYNQIPLIDFSKKEFKGFNREEIASFLK